MNIFLVPYGETVSRKAIKIFSPIFCILKILKIKKNTFNIFFNEKKNY